DLLARLDGARPRHEHHVVGPDAGAVRQLDDRVVRAPLARHLLVRLGDVDDLEHTGQRLELGAVHLAVIADEADGSALLSGDGPCVVAHLPDRIDYATDLGGGRGLIHYDEHGSVWLKLAPREARRVVECRSGGGWGKV